MSFGKWSLTNKSRYTHNTWTNLHLYRNFASSLRLETKVRRARVRGSDVSRQFVGRGFGGRGSRHRRLDLGLWCLDCVDFVIGFLRLLWLCFAGVGVDFD